jgi:hypothetical protein
VVGNGSTSITYQYSEGSCTTGLQVSSSFQELCAKLQDDRLNCGCARFARQTRFNLDCLGR